ncbi:MAG: hypothetical protein ABIK09_02645 [Pseudomonadota bacterium]
MRTSFTFILVLLLLAPADALAEDCWDAARPFAEKNDWAAVEKTLRGFPARDRACQLLLAEAQIHQGKHTWALQILRLLVEADPRDAVARGLLGAALLGMGDHESLLEVARELPPTTPGDPWTGILEHQRAAAELRTGDAHTARLRLTRVLRERPLHPFRDEANRFLGLAWWYDYRDRGQPTLDLATGFQYDSNAAFDPDDPLLSVVEGDPAAWRGWLSASGRIPLVWEPRTVVTANASAYRSFHSTAIANDFNYTDVSGGATLVHRMLWGQADASIEVAWLSRIGLLDGGPLLPEPRIFAFLENHSFAAGFRVEPAAGVLLGFTGVGGYQRFAELARNNLGGGGLLSLLWSVGVVDLAFTGSGIYREAESEGYDRYELATRLTVSLRLPWEVRLGASGGLGHDDYLDSAGWFEAGSRRRDTRWDARATLGRPIAAGFGVEVHGGYGERRSTVGAFAYDHWTAGLTLSWSHAWD